MTIPNHRIIAGDTVIRLTGAAAQDDSGRVETVEAPLAYVRWDDSGVDEWVEIAHASLRFVGGLARDGRRALRRQMQGKDRRYGQVRTYQFGEWAPLEAVEICDSCWTEHIQGRRIVNVRTGQASGVVASYYHRPSELHDGTCLYCGDAD